MGAKPTACAASYKAKAFMVNRVKRPRPHARPRKHRPVPFDISLAFTYGAPSHTNTNATAPQHPRRARAASLHVRMRRPLPRLRAERQQRQHLLPRQRLLARAAAPFLWSSPGRIIAPSSRAVAFCGSYPRRVWAPFYSAGGSGGVRARSRAAIRAKHTTDDLNSLIR